MKTDNGTAPCVDHGILTLAICKPAIRRMARENDWLLGFTPKARGWKLAYAAEIKTRIPGKKYYAGAKSTRKDMIYRVTNEGEFVLKHKKVHDERNVSKDVGERPTYRNAWILRSNRFWYFGAIARHLSEFGNNPSLQSKLENLTQGHRVHHSEEVRHELEDLIEKLNEIRPGVHGKPRNTLQLTCEEDVASSCHGVC